LIVDILIIDIDLGKRWFNKLVAKLLRYLSTPPAEESSLSAYSSK
jgi:hypothetical protein